MIPKQSKKILGYNAKFIVVFVILLLIIITAILRYNVTMQSKVDWLNQSDWSHFTGSEEIDGGIRIFPTERVINHRDTSTAQPNPPINMRGSYLKTSSDFRIDFAVSGVDNEATVQFYGQIPVIYDEWRQERSSIRITVTNDEVYARIWDGTAVSSIDERKYSLNLCEY